MKRYDIKSMLIGFVICLVISTVIVGASYLYKASDIEFTPTNTDWNVDNIGYEWTTQKGSQVGVATISGIGIESGHTGNGYAKITLISID